MGLGIFFLDYPGGLEVIARILKCREGSREVRTMHGERSQLAAAGFGKRMESQAQECRQLTDAGKARTKFLPWSLQKEAALLTLCH